ncbi:MAG TPA: putative zinc-binding protein [Candidatus Gastranaerophilaceae bacterium]|nr:putative zinc-binding protein [Candidatus Gastranaerophilaceae bacterium]HPT41985.1 putative zinc-binding protein [Candidatus Gastranaerophilaceae bacterium]
MSKNKVKIIPCSGMGKAFGLIARESTLESIKKCPQDAETVCLAYVVTGDEEAKKLVEGQKCITIDGCPAMCSAKNIEIAGGIIEEKIRVVDVFRNHRGVNAGSATELTEDGWKIVDEIAEDVAKKIKGAK